MSGSDRYRITPQSTTPPVDVGAALERYVRATGRLVLVLALLGVAQLVGVMLAFVKLRGC